MKPLLRSCVMSMLLACTVFVGAKAPGQSVAETYRQAAQAYRDAADKTSEDKKGCYNEWATYYDCLADELQSPSNRTCSPPTCKPGE